MSQRGRVKPRVKKHQIAIYGRDRASNMGYQMSARTKRRLAKKEKQK